VIAEPSTVAAILGEPASEIEVTETRGGHGG